MPKLLATIVPVCVLLGFSALDSVAQNSFQLSDGTRTSNVTLAAGKLVVIRGTQKYVYDRSPTLDSRDGQYRGFHCAAVNASIRWPVSNQGSLYALKNGAWTLTRMKVKTLAGSAQSGSGRGPGTGGIGVGGLSTLPSTNSLQGVWSSVETGGATTMMSLQSDGRYTWNKKDEFGDLIQQERGRWIVTVSKTEPKEFTLTVKTDDGFRSKFAGKWNQAGTKIRLTGSRGVPVTFTHAGGPVAARLPALPKYRQGQIIETRHGKARVENRTRMVTVSKERIETRTRRVPRRRADGRMEMVDEKYEVRVPYREQVRQNYQVCKTLSDGTVYELTHDLILDPRPRSFWWRRRLVQEFVPNPSLEPASIKLANSHKEEIILMVSEYLPPGARPLPKARQMSIKPGKTITLQVERDSGGMIVVSDRDTGEIISKTVVPPRPLYDIATYEFRIQSISIDLDGSKTISRGIKSVGVFTVPAGRQLVDNQLLDIYRESRRANNTGKVSRYPKPEY